MSTSDRQPIIGPPLKPSCDCRFRFANGNHVHYLTIHIAIWGFVIMAVLTAVAILNSPVFLWVKIGCGCAAISYLMLIGGSWCYVRGLYIPALFFSFAITYLCLILWIVFLAVGISSLDYEWHFEYDSDGFPNRIAYRPQEEKEKLSLLMMLFKALFFVIPLYLGHKMCNLLVLDLVWLGTDEAAECRKRFIKNLQEKADENKSIV